MKESLLHGVAFAILLLVFVGVLVGCSKQGPRPDTVYIDSIPDGADVYLVSKNESVEDKLLGKTPLAVDSAKCPGMNFAVVMNMDYYCKEIRKLKTRTDWPRRFCFGLSGSVGAVRPLDFFQFESSKGKVAQEFTGKIHSLGTIQELDWPRKNRICILFLPTGVPIEEFFPLMPPSGTFRVEHAGLKASLEKNFEMSDAQAEVAVQSLTRCGAYEGYAKLPGSESRVRYYRITYSKPPLDYLDGRVSEEELVGKL